MKISFQIVYNLEEIQGTTLNYKLGKFYMKRISSYFIIWLNVFLHI